MGEYAVGADEIREELRRRADVEGGAQFMNWPDRWWEAHTWRCETDHVSTMVLKSEQLGRDACIAGMITPAGTCLRRVTLTFPEDRDGPLLMTPDGRARIPEGGDE